MLIFYCYLLICIWVDTSGPERLVHNVTAGSWTFEQAVLTKYNLLDWCKNNSLYFAKTCSAEITLKILGHLLWTFLYIGRGSRAMQIYILGRCTRLKHPTESKRHCMRLLWAVNVGTAWTARYDGICRFYDGHFTPQKFMTRVYTHKRDRLEYQKPVHLFS